MTNYAKLFGGVFSRIEEYTYNSPTGGGSPLYSRAVKMLDTFLEKKLDNSVLDNELVDWIDSKVLDDLRKDHTENLLRGSVKPSIFTVLCSEGHLELAKWVFEKHPEMVIHDSVEIRNTENHHPFLAKLDRILAPYVRKAHDFTLTCEKGHFEVIKWLAQTFPEIITDDSIKIAFQNSCFEGRFEIVKWLVEKYTDKVKDVDQGFRWACMNNHFELAEWLLEKYPKIDVHGEREEVFVQLCSTGSLERVKWFVEKYPETKDNEEGEAFIGACVEGNIDVVRWTIEKYGSGYGMGFIGYVLEEVCQKGNKEVATVLFNRWPTKRNKSILNKFFPG